MVGKYKVITLCGSTRSEVEYAEAYGKKVHLMMSYTGSGRDVADPWYTGNLTDVYVFT